MRVLPFCEDSVDVGVVQVEESVEWRDGLAEIAVGSADREVD